MSNLEPWLETEEFHYIWKAMTVNLIGNIIVGACNDVIKHALNRAKPGNEPTLIGGIMNTDHSNRSGSHWVLWTYSRSDGMTIYDPYDNDSCSSHVKELAEDKGLKVVIKPIGQQHSEDGWSCGYRVLFWALQSAMKAHDKSKFA